MTAHKKFKSFSDVLLHYDIHYIQEDFNLIKTAQINETIKDEIAFTLNEVPYKVSEAAICENLIYPLKRSLENVSGYFFNLESSIFRRLRRFFKNS